MTWDFKRSLVCDDDEAFAEHALAKCHTDVKIPPSKCFCRSASVWLPLPLSAPSLSLCFSISLCLYLSIYLSIIYLYAYLYLSVSLPTYLSTYPFVCVSRYLSFYLCTHAFSIDTKVISCMYIHTCNIYIYTYIIHIYC